MKVFHFFAELKFSGAEIMYVSAAEEFKKKGCDLVAISTKKEKGEYAVQFEKAGYEVLHWPFEKNSISRIFSYVKKVINYLRDHKVDVIHIHRGDLLLLLTYCAWKANCKSVYTFHNVFPTRWFSYPFHIVIRKFVKSMFHCKFQTIGDSVYKHEKDFYFNSTIQINNWYNHLNFYPASQGEKNKVRHDLGIPKNTFVIISIGGCSPIKRHDHIIKALPKIIRDYPDFIYFHLGKGESLEEEQKLAKKLRVDRFIWFLGNQLDVRKYLIAADIYVMPSKFEGLPITAIETMACKIPTVLYDVPGLRDFNNEKECAKIIPENHKVLASSLIELYRNPKAQDLIVRNAKTHVDKYYSMTSNASKIFELYN